MDEMDMSFGGDDGFSDSSYDTSFDTTDSFDSSDSFDDFGVDDSFDDGFDMIEEPVVDDFDMVEDPIDMEDEYITEDGGLEPIEDEIVEDEIVEDEIVEDEIIEDEIVEDEIVEDEIVEDEIVEDEIVEDEIVEDEIVEDEIIENEIVEDEIIEDEIVEDEIIEDEIVEDEIVEDEIVEDEIVEDEIVEDEIVEDEIVEDEIVEDEIVEDEIDQTDTPATEELEEISPVEYEQDYPVIATEDIKDVSDGSVEDSQTKEYKDPVSDVSTELSDKNQGKIDKPLTGYQAFERGEKIENRTEAVLTRKTCKRWLEAKNENLPPDERLTPEQIDQKLIDYGFQPPEIDPAKRKVQQPITIRHGYEGDTFADVYGDGEKGKGDILTTQDARHMSQDERVARLGLEEGNDGYNVRNAELARDQFVITTTADGGGTRIFTEGTYEDGAVRKGYQGVDDVTSQMGEAERAIYEHTDTTRAVIDRREALIRNDIDYNKVDKRGRTNLERMQKGLAPLDSTGKTIELHHMGQGMDAPLIELTRDEHRGKGNDTILHDKSIRSHIHRKSFGKERREYWKQRAKLLA